MGRRSKYRSTALYVAVPLDILDDPAYQALRYSSRAVLIEILRLITKTLNPIRHPQAGDQAEIGYSVLQRGIGSHAPATISAALKELEAKGFISREQPVESLDNTQSTIITLLR